MIPVYKIETTGAVKNYTITDKAFSINVHDCMTDATGMFTVVLPSDTEFEDIVEHDLIKIYLGYDVPPVLPTFTGRVQKIEDGLTTQYGYSRKISGLALGEVLLRRIKCGHYSGMKASDIVKEFTADFVPPLGNADIDTENSTPPIEVMNETYFDAMKTLSDCWLSAGVPLKKDFYVTAANNLFYKDRASGRTVGVESLEIGKNISTYSVRRSLENLRNNITVYGAWDELFTTKSPFNENWTEDIPYWIATVGTLSKDTGTKVLGAASIKCAGAGSGIDYNADFNRSFKPEYAFVSGNAKTITQSFSRLHYQCVVDKAVTNGMVYLFAPDATNYFYRAAGFGVTGWYTWDFTLPTTDALNGWTKSTADAQANFITGIRFYEHENAPFNCWIDDLALQGGRFNHQTSDGTSITNYGQRDLIVIDDNLKTATQCEARAKTLLYQRKDPVTELDISTPGNTNILLGDKLPLVLPRAKINTTFDVITVDHTVTSNNVFLTKFTATQGIENRYSISLSPIQEISRLKATIRALGRDSKTIRI